MGGPPAR
jgi:hypothetical protein